MIMKSIEKPFEKGPIDITLFDGEHSLFGKDRVPDSVALYLGKAGFQLSYHMSVEEFKQFVEMVKSIDHAIAKAERRIANV